MSVLDYAILILIGLAGLKGFLHGFMRSTIGMAAIAVGVLVAARAWPLLYPYTQRVIRHAVFAKWASVVVLAAGTTVLFDWILGSFGRVFERGLMGRVNQLAGGGLNILFTAVFLGLGLLVVDQYGGDALGSAIHDSILAPPLVSLARQLLGVAQPILQDKEAVKWITV